MRVHDDAQHRRVCLLRENDCISVLVCVRMLTGSMGCGGSRSAAIEPRYYESRDTESTWLTSTDTETQRTAAGNGTGESANDNEKTAAAAAAAGSGQTRTSLLNTDII